jgi:hypothetical protein
VTARDGARPEKAKVEARGGVTARDGARRGEGRSDGARPEKARVEARGGDVRRQRPGKARRGDAEQSEVRQAAGRGKSLAMP